MNVQEFVKQTLFEIAAAVEDVNGKFALNKIDAQANPKGATNYFGSGTVRYSSICDTQTIDFDIAVTATQTDGHSSEAGGGLRVYVASAGAETSSKSEMVHSNVSRIKFQIPLKLPAKASE